MVNPIDKNASTFESLGLGLQREEAKPHNELGQEDFLQLMLAQLRHQDPLKPLENGEFIGQMAQFSTVSGIQDLSGAFNQLASSLQSNRALQASSLVGRSVLVPTDRAKLEPGTGVEGTAEVTAAATAVTVSIQDASGQTVRSFELGPQPAGAVKFVWDGLNDTGQAMPAGEYRIRVDAMIDGEMSALPTHVASKVESVSLDQGGAQDITLNVAGVGPVSLSDVDEIL